MAASSLQKELSNLQKDGRLLVKLQLAEVREDGARGHLHTHQLKRTDCLLRYIQWSYPLLPIPSRPM
jgi:hypothetical protein